MQSTTTQQSFTRALEEIRMSPIVSISEEVRELAQEFEKSGRQFIRFQRGEIDFPTPAYIVAAIQEGLEKGLTKYPRSGGEDFFKDAVIARLGRDHDVGDLSAQHIVATYGGQEALELSFKLFRSGAGFSPTWSCALENFVPYAQIDFEEVPLNSDFSVDFDRLEDAVRGREFFYLNNPQNPTGKVFSEEELTRIVEICTRHGLFVIADEAYEKIVYGDSRHWSLVRVPQDNIITIFTFSKTYSMTGWRLGYAVTRNEKVAKLLRLGNYTQTAGVTTFLQYAGAQALNNTEQSESSISTMLAEFTLRRDALYEALKDLPGVRLSRPEGAFYMFPDFSERIPADLTGTDRDRYIYNKLAEQGVACVYGSCFGKHFGDNVRLSFSATPVAAIDEAAGRLRSIFD
ncbi:MAG: aminotransferase class I/II-fold pyridoxal phosphate-dependent enzyme [Candidatus Krumholzibacteriota bacterium]|nr:aminotransferase class I/II-fold pyridoxal phosphate-dependent enzyme [Candidatus Krumholzibacteriota bacterium]